MPISKTYQPAIKAEMQRIEKDQLEAKQKESEQEVLEI